MAGRVMQLALEIKGRLDGSVQSSMQKAINESRQLQTQIRQANQAMREAQRAADAEQRSTGRVSTAQYQRIAELQARINALTQRRSDILDAQAAKEQAGARFSKATGALGAGIAVTAAAAAPLAAADSPYSPEVCGWALTIAKLAASAFVISAAEELFFRRWLVDFAGFWWMVALFAVEHGDRWAVGAVAGVVYGLVARRFGLSSAIAAHAVTNFALGLLVIFADHWEFW